MLFMQVLLELVFLNFIFQNRLFELVSVRDFVIDRCLNAGVGFTVEVVEELIDMLVGISVELEFIVSGIKQKRT